MPGLGAAHRTLSRPRGTASPVPRTNTLADAAAERHGCSAARHGSLRCAARYTREARQRIAAHQPLRSASTPAHAATVRSQREPWIAVQSVPGCAVTASCFDTAKLSIWKRSGCSSGSSPRTRRPPGSLAPSGPPWTASSWVRSLSS